jgi:GT2 family glycosyltransferase
MMHSMNIDLSIIIVNWNTRNLVVNCLRSIFTYSPHYNFEVWVVDNASSDGSPDMVRKNFPQVKLIENPANVGFARANNQAIRQCHGRYIMLLNPDTEVTPGALETMVGFMEVSQEVGAAGPRLINPDGTLQTSCYPTPTLLREFWRLLHLDRIKPFGIYPMQEWDQNQPREVEVIQGACLILRREALDQTGFLNEDYFIYSEEVDLCYRLRKSGWKISWLPGATVTHYGGKSTQLVSEEMFLNLYESKVLFFRKNYSWLQAFVYKMILTLAAIARLVTAPVAGMVLISQRKRLREIANNYRRLLIALPRL